MRLFKSKEERRIERDLQVRRAVAHLNRQIKQSERHTTDYITKAKRARKLGWHNQEQFLRRAVRNTATIKVRLERQLLALESAVQMKEQAENHYEFARAMGALSKSIAVAFGATDMAKTQANFEKAMAQAESLEERMDLFLSMTADSVFNYEGSSEEQLVTDADIEKLLTEDVREEEQVGADRQIEAEISRIQQEIEKSRK